MPFRKCHSANASPQKSIISSYASHRLTFHDDNQVQIVAHNPPPYNGRFVPIGRLLDAHAYIDGNL